MDFVDFNKMNTPLTIANVPPAIHWRTTMQFWVFVHDTRKFGNVAINVIYQDFMTISIVNNQISNLDIDYICTPIEFLYSVQGQVTGTNLRNRLITTLNAPFITDTTTGAGSSSKWIWVRCGFTFDSNKMYLNTIAETALPIPQMYTTYSNYPNFLKKFYKEQATTNIRIENAPSINTEIYLRNLNIFRDYMPQSMVNLKYL